MRSSKERGITQIAREERVSLTGGTAERKT